MELKVINGGSNLGTLASQESEKWRLQQSL